MTSQNHSIESTAVYYLEDGRDIQDELEKSVVEASIFFVGEVTDDPDNEGYEDSRFLRDAHNHWTQSLETYAVGKASETKALISQYNKPGKGPAEYNTSVEYIVDPSTATRNDPAVGLITRADIEGANLKEADSIASNLIETAEEELEQQFQEKGLSFEQVDERLRP